MTCGNTLRTIASMGLSKERRAQLRWSSYIANYGPDDPRTIRAARAYILAQIEAHEAELARLRERLAEAVPA